MEEMRISGGRKKVGDGEKRTRGKEDPGHGMIGGGTRRRTPRSARIPEKKRDKEPAGRS